jgi:hypothetical protein
MNSRRRVNSAVMSVRSLMKFAVSASVLVVGIVCSGCRSSKSHSPNSSDKPLSIQTKQPEYVADPTCCGLTGGPGTKGLDAAWRAFTNDGRYRLARKDDFKTSARASDDPFNSIFAYCWGRLGYDTNADSWYHLATIVVDTQKTDDARFGLVIFSAPKDGDGTYRPYWLYRERDLSRTVVWTGSGDLMVADYREDGSRDVSYVQWDARRKQFVATSSRPKPT